MYELRDNQESYRETKKGEFEWDSLINLLNGLVHLYERKTTDIDREI